MAAAFFHGADFAVGTDQSINFSELSGLPSLSPRGAAFQRKCCSEGGRESGWYQNGDSDGGKC